MAMLVKFQTHSELIAYWIPGMHGNSMTAHTHTHHTHTAHTPHPPASPF